MAQPKTITFPFTPGDHVWFLSGYCVYEIHECILTQWICTQEGNFCKLMYLDRDTREPVVELRNEFPESDIGKWIFPTAEDAQSFCDSRDIPTTDYRRS